MGMIGDLRLACLKYIATNTHVGVDRQAGQLFRLLTEHVSKNELVVVRTVKIDGTATGVDRIDGNGEDMVEPLVQVQGLGKLAADGMHGIDLPVADFKDVGAFHGIDGNGNFGLSG